MITSNLCQNIKELVLSFTNTISCLVECGGNNFDFYYKQISDNKKIKRRCGMNVYETESKNAQKYTGFPKFFNKA